MKKYIFMAVAVMAAFSSCKDDSNIIIDTPIIDNESPTIFTATMEGAPETRATYNSEHKCAAWEVNDQIIINGHLFLAQASGTSTTFSQVLEHEKRPIYVSSESNGFSNNEAPIMLVDESGTNTKWCANTSHKNGKTAWNIIVRTERPVKLHAIKLWNGGDTDEYPDRRWKKIKVLGGAQESPCDYVIGTFGDLNLEANKGGFAGTIDVNATSAYEYYKIEVQEIEGGDVMQMSDMTFVYEEEKIDNPPFHAYFPATLYDGTTAVLPSQITEEWTDGKFNMPMYASSETTDLQFKNLCGVLKITVNDEDLASVKSITVSSANCATSGAFTVNAENAAELSDPSDASKSVTVTYNTAVETDAEGKVFYVPIPAQTYQELKIKISDGTNSKFMVTTSGKNIVVERNRIYPIDFKSNFFPGRGKAIAIIDGQEVEVVWMQLWENGPKFAEYNIAGNPEDPNPENGYFTWGGSVSRENTDSYKGEGDLSGENDTATKLWGSNWRMPTLEEFKALINNCTSAEYLIDKKEWGYDFTGKGPYSSNVVRFPGKGSGEYYIVGINAYWSSTAYGSANAYYFALNYGPSVDVYPRGYRFSVRPVLKE